MAEKMGLPRQDKQQPIIIQNCDLLLPGQIKSKRKPLCTANLYLSAAFFRRRGGITLSDNSKCLQSSSRGSHDCGDVIDVSGWQTSRSSLSDQAVRTAEPVLQVRSEDILLDQRQQILILPIPPNTTTSTSETLRHGFRSAGEISPCSSRSSGEAPLHRFKSTGETPPYNSRSTGETPPYNSKSLRKHRVSQPGSTYQNIRTSADDFSIYNNIPTNHSGKIKVRFGEGKSVMDVKRISASILNQKSHQQGPRLAKTHSGSEDKTAFQISVEFELNQSQLGTKPIPDDGLSTKGSLLNDCTHDRHITNTFKYVENSNFHVKDKTMTVAEKEDVKKTFSQCDFLYNFETQTSPMNEACTRTIGDVYGESCERKGEETASKMKRVSFKLSQDKEVKFSNSSDVSAQIMVDAEKQGNDQSVSSVDRNDVALFRAVNVDPIPRLFDTGHLPDYPSNLSAHPSCVNDAHNSSYQATARRNKTVPGKQIRQSRGKPGSTSHIDRVPVSMGSKIENYVVGDTVFMKTNTASDVYKNSAAMQPQTQSEVNTNYLRRLYSLCGNRTQIRGIGSAFDKNVHLHGSRLPDEELVAFGRDVGSINRRKTKKCTDNSNNTCAEARQQDKHFTAEQDGDERHSAVPRVRSAQDGDERHSAGPRVRSASSKGDPFGLRDNMKYVDRCLFQIDRKENERTPMNKRLEKLIVSNLRLHRPTLFLGSSTTGLL